MCLVHLGGTRIGGILLAMDGDQGPRLLRLVRPRTAVPIHYDDYTVFRAPLAGFRAAVEDQRLETNVHYLDRGDTYRFTAPATQEGTR